MSPFSIFSLILKKLLAYSDLLISGKQQVGIVKFFVLGSVILCGEVPKIAISSRGKSLGDRSSHLGSKALAAS